MSFFKNPIILNGTSPDYTGNEQFFPHRTPHWWMTGDMTSELPKTTRKLRSDHEEGDEGLIRPQLSPLFD